MDSTISTLNLFSSTVSSVGGFDKALALIQYTSKMAILLNSRSGVKARDGSTAHLSNLARVINDSRTLFRFRGSFPLISQGLDSVFSSKQNPNITGVMKLQLLSMLIYYPLEHTYWLGAQGILPIKPETIGKSALWSCRAWMTYNFLEFINIYKKHNLLSKRTSFEEENIKELTAEKRQLKIQTLSMLCYTLMSVHYSLPQSPFNAVQMDVAGFVAAVLAYCA